MKISHEQAQHFIQRRLDSALREHEAAMLSAHLHECTNCRAYAEEMSEVERLLFPVMKKHWALQPAPLSIPALRQRNTKLQTGTFLVMRNAVISFLAFAVFFGVWQFMLSSPSASSQIPIVPPMPTPFIQTAQSARVTTTLENCELTSYAVQDNDTLAGIAQRFSVAEEEIITLNHLQTDALRPSVTLIIPVCTSTPTGTVHPVTFTTTHTPIGAGTTSTPGG